MSLDPSSHRLAPGTALGNRPCILLGLLGCYIGLSRTPALHEQEAEAQGLRLCYRLFDRAHAPLAEAEIGTFLACLEQAGFRGLNVTHPYKEAILPHLDELSPTAATVGSVNTVIFEGGRRLGHNTDAPGFARAIREEFGDLAGLKAVQLGAGGAGRAVAYALLNLGIAALRLFDIVQPRAAALAERLSACGHGRVTVVSNLEAAMASADLLINATPVGMLGHPGIPIDPALLHGSLRVVDIVYVPRETALLREARRRGLATLDGSGMAIFQAVEAFRLFTEREADAARMAATFERLQPLAEAAAGSDKG